MYNLKKDKAMNMKRYKYIMTFVLAFMTLPMMAQDYMNIFFKNGDHRKFYMKNITEIVATKIDADGVEHEDYSFQQITTIYDKYIYKLEDVDSITFTKIDEELAEHNFVTAMPQVFSAIEDCETIADVEKKIDQIKNTEGVTDAWSDGHQLYVSIAEGETFKFHFSHDVGSDDSSIENDVAQTRAMISDMANIIKAKDSPLKVLIANQEYKSKNRDWSKLFDPLIDDFAKCGVTVKPLDGPTVDFFYDNSDNPENPHFFDYDVIFLVTHGGYCCFRQYVNGILSWTEYLHDIVTSDEILVVDKKSDNWWKDNYDSFKEWRDSSNFKDATDEQINFTFIPELRTSKFGSESWVLYPVLTERFFQDIAVGKFHNPKSVLFNTACQSMKGNSSADQFSFADQLFSHGLGVYIGYTEEDKFGPETGTNLFRKMLLNHSLDKAISDLPAYQKVESKKNVDNSDLPWYDKWNFVDHGASLHPYSNPNSEYNDVAQQLFLFPTITNEIDQETVLQSFNSSKSIEVSGYATAASYNPDNFSMGFMFWENEDMASATKISNVEVTELTKPLEKGNILFRTSLTDLKPDQTYHYRAYTYDGQNYNYGEVFTLYPVLQVSAQKFELGKGEKVSFTITAGSGEYSVESSNAMVATASVNGNEVKIETFDAGSVTITVTDTKTHQTANVYVTVTEVVNPPHIEDLHIDATSIELIVGESKSITITSGNGDYTVKSSNESVATVSINGTTVTVKAISAGSKVAITITDSKSGQTATVYVTVTEAVTPIDNPEDVIDLGLPSGMLWASCNIGATKPEEVGEYYAWGEISPNWYDASGKYSMDNSHSAMGLNWDMTKYCTKEKYGTVDNKISLDLNDDVAHIVLGGRYRMPTKDDFEELVNNCTSEWTTFNGVNGCKFTGHNGNSVFFPATGMWMKGIPKYMDVYGNYWSRSLYTELPYEASILRVFDESAIGGEDPVGVGNEERYKCKPIRAVMLPEGSPSNLVDFALSGSMNPIIGLGEKCKLNVVSGNGSYTSSSKHPSIANISINNNGIEITGQNPGTTIIYITDKCSGQDIMVNVTVTPKTETPAAAVDLGLPSGTKWASYNLGATRPEDYGGYYAWGELEKKDSYSWNTYLHCDGEDYSCYELPNPISGTIYDIVKMKWGGSWRMPTMDDFSELSENCQVEWVSRNGIKGCLVTGSNGNSIFLPASGWIGGDTKNNVNEYGLYWMPYQFEDNRYYGKSLAGFIGESGIDEALGDRYAGYSIRPVTKE